MKAVTLQQPWASLHAHGWKGWETRDWETHYRGRIAIHAASTIKPESRLAVESSTILQRAIYAMGYGSTWWARMPVGVIVSTADVDLVLFGSDDPIDEADHANLLFDDDLPFGDFGHDRALWRLRTNAHRLLDTVACAGNQGVWEVSKGLERAIKSARSTSIQRRTLRELGGMP